VGRLCNEFPNSYWREVDKRKEYPESFVKALSSAGLLGALVPREYGGSGLGITEASIILEEINRNGGNSAASHAQMYVMSILTRHGSLEQKKKYLPSIASGELRLQAFGITEPKAGVDTTRIETFAKKEEEGRKYVINGHKIFISRIQHSDLMLLLARTTKYEEARSKIDGMSIFIIDLRKAGNSIRVEPIETMINHETNELFIENLEVPEENLIGKEGEGFRYVLDGLNAERILIAAECIGDATFCLEKAVDYAKNRIVFDRPIGMNQGVQFPLSQLYAKISSANLMRYRAASLFDQGKSCGKEANMAKLLASEASVEAANTAMTTMGGYGMTTAFDVERKLRESRLFIVAPLPNYMILSYLAEHVLSLPRSY
jgi:acyl-CoA dehydrogenase